MQALIIFSAGATAGLSCSMCEAGTYGTGSGQDARTRTPVLRSRKTVLQLSGFSFFLFCLGYLKIYSPSSGWTVRSQDLTLTIFAAGATAGISCSLCEAGTYWTGSGQDPLTEKTKELAIDDCLYFSHTFVEAQLFGSRNLSMTVFAAGATSGLNCSLCYAGTYLTGSGQDAFDCEKLCIACRLGSCIKY